MALLSAVQLEAIALAGQQNEIILSARLSEMAAPGM